MDIRLPDGTTLSVDDASATLDDYWTRDAPAVWDLYDNLVPGPKNAITEVDVLAINALNAFSRGAPMTGMTSLWSSQATRDAVEAGLKPITTQPLETLGDAERKAAAQRLDTVTTLVERECRGIGPVSASKLIHRTRPALATIWDKRVGRFYDASKQDWAPFHLRVWDDILASAAGLRAAIQRSVHDTVSLVRAWDVLLWMKA
jgi:hypothetical protein